MPAQKLEIQDFLYHSPPYPPPVFPTTDLAHHASNINLSVCATHTACLLSPTLLVSCHPQCSLCATHTACFVQGLSTHMQSVQTFSNTTLSSASTVNINLSFSATQILLCAGPEHAHAQCTDTTDTQRQDPLLSFHPSEAKHASFIGGNHHHHHHHVLPMRDPGACQVGSLMAHCIGGADQ